MIGNLANTITAIGQDVKGVNDKFGWQTLATATDLNTLTQTGKYFLQATGNPNSPNTTWRYFVVVERINETRITQTIWQETNASLIYRRLWVDNKWTGWEQEITNAQFIAKLNGTWLGGRNYLLNSQQTRTEHGTTNFEFSPNVDLSLVRYLTLSVDVDCVNVRRTTQSGAKWFRIGAETKITYTDNSVAYFAVWHNPPATGTNSRFGRINNRLTVPTGKTIKTIDSCVIQIWDVAGDKMVVKNPKLELGHLMSDWTPAPEDLVFNGTSGGELAIPNETTKAMPFVQKWCKIVDTSPPNRSGKSINHPFARNKIVGISYRIDGDGFSSCEGLLFEIHDNSFMVESNYSNANFANKPLSIFIKYTE